MTLHIPLLVGCQCGIQLVLRSPQQVSRIMHRRDFEERRNLQDEHKFNIEESRETYHL